MTMSVLQRAMHKRNIGRIPSFFRNSSPAAHHEPLQRPDGTDIGRCFFGPLDTSEDSAPQDSSTVEDLGLDLVELWNRGNPAATPVYESAFYDDDIDEYAGVSGPLLSDIETEPRMDYEGWSQCLEIDPRLLEERTRAHAAQVIHQHTILTPEDSHRPCQRLKLDPQLETPWAHIDKDIPVTVRSAPADAFDFRSRRFNLDCQLAESLQTRDMIYRNTSPMSTSTDSSRTSSRSGSRSPSPPPSPRTRGKKRNYKGEMIEFFSPHSATSYSTPSYLPNLEALHISSPTRSEYDDPDIVRLHIASLRDIRDRLVEQMGGLGDERRVGLISTAFDTVSEAKGGENMELHRLVVERGCCRRISSAWSGC